MKDIILFPFRAIATAIVLVTMFILLAIYYVFYVTIIIFRKDKENEIY